MREKSLNYWTCSIVIQQKQSILSLKVGRDSAVGIATCYELDGPEIESR